MSHKVMVTSRAGVRDAIEWFGGYDTVDGIIVISIHDPDLAPEFKPDEKFPKVLEILTLSFWDELDDCYGCMDKNQAKAVAEFVMKHKEDAQAIIVHCEAGISRSAGVGAALAHFLNGDDSYFFRGRFAPNRTCYRRVLNALLDMRPEEPLRMLEQEGEE